MVGDCRVVYGTPTFPRWDENVLTSEHSLLTPLEGGGTATQKTWQHKGR